MCCELEVSKCICALDGTYAQIVHICGNLKNGGIDCSICPASSRRNDPDPDPAAYPDPYVMGRVLVTFTDPVALTDLPGLRTPYPKHYPIIPSKGPFLE